MSTEKKRNFVVGLTTLLSALLLVGLLLLFGWVPSVLEKVYPLTITFPHASGLHQDSAVRISGIAVGRVRQVRLAEVPGTGVEVQIVIQQRIRLPETVRAVVQSPLLGGSASIELIPQIDPAQTQASQVFLPMDGSARLAGEADSLVGTLTQELQTALIEPTAQFSRLNQTLETLAVEWAAVGRNLRSLTDLRETGSVDQGQAEGNLATVLARADRRLAELETTLTGFNALTGDPELRADLKAAAAGARDLSQQAGSSLQALEQRYVLLADELVQAAGSAQALLTDARSGKGAVGRALQDPAVYENLNDAAERLGLAIDELRLLIQKWKAEGLPIQF